MAQENDMRIEIERGSINSDFDVRMVIRGTIDGKLDWLDLLTMPDEWADVLEEYLQQRDAVLVTRRMANLANARLRRQLLRHLDIPDDGVTSLSAYIDRLAGSRSRCAMHGIAQTGL